MSNDALRRFTEKLHGPPDQMEERGHPDWGIAPPAYRPAAGMSGWRLPPPFAAEVPADADPLRILSTLLWTSLGCDRVRLFPQGLPSDAASGQAPAPRLLPGRPIASGGASYPGDLVVALDTADGVTTWRYAPQYHALFRDAAAVVVTPPLSARGGSVGRDTLTIHACVNFHRTWLKYRDFAYRLTAVDLGVLVARLCTVAHALGIAAEVDVDDPGIELDRTLGLDRDSEASYATVRMRLPGIAHATPARLEPASGSMATIQRSPPPLGQAFRAMHQAASAPPEPRSGGNCAEQLQLPAWRFGDLLGASRARSSSGESFNGGAVEASVLHGALRQGAAAASAFCGTDSELRRRMPALRCTVINVEGHPPGVYRFDAGSGQLECVRPGRFADDLQRALFLGNVNLEAAAFVVHPIGPKDWDGTGRGARTYRVAQMLAGAALEGAMLASSGRGRTAHAFLGFLADQVDAIYRLPGDARALAQLAVGNCRHRFGIMTSTVT